MTCVASGLVKLELSSLCSACKTSGLFRPLRTLSSLVVLGVVALIAANRNSAWRAAFGCRTVACGRVYGVAGGTLGEEECVLWTKEEEC